MTSRNSIQFITNFTQIWSFPTFQIKHLREKTSFLPPTQPIVKPDPETKKNKNQRKKSSPSKNPNPKNRASSRPGNCSGKTRTSTSWTRKLSGTLAAISITPVRPMFSFKIVLLTRMTCDFRGWRFSHSVTSPPGRSCAGTTRTLSIKSRAKRSTASAGQRCAEEDFFKQMYKFFLAKLQSPLVCRWTAKKDFIFNVKHILVFNCATFYGM